jgi:hypothetical protein
MTYSAFFNDDVLLSARFISHLSMIFWQMVFIACFLLISYLFYTVFLPDNRRF